MSGGLNNTRDTNRSQSAWQNVTRPHAAAACSGLQFSESQALTSAPASSRSWNIGSVSLIQHCIHNTAIPLSHAEITDVTDFNFN